MKVRYDQEVDVLYLCLTEGNVTESDEVRPGIIIDFAEDGTPLGVEILDAKNKQGILPLKVELELLGKTKK